MVIDNGPLDALMVIDNAPVDVEEVTNDIVEVTADSVHELKQQVTTSTGSSPMAPSYSDVTVSDVPSTSVPIEELEPADLESDSSSMHTTLTSDTASALATHQIRSLPTYKLVGDNLNKSIQPLEEIGTYHKNIHLYFHSYAVKDRLELGSFEDSPSLSDLQKANIEPTADDNIALKSNFVTLAARIIHNHMPFFKKTIGSIKPILCAYAKEMSQKSQVVIGAD